MPDPRAAAILAAFDGNTQIDPLTHGDPALSLDAGYAISSDVDALRIARGERHVGRKIGFTNTSIWPIYNVDAPVWGWMYDHGVHDMPADGVIPLPALPELRIEPEIVFGFKSSPGPDMSLEDISACIDWVAHGFEIVISLYPKWQFTAPDSVAAMAMHGALWIGPKRPPIPERLAALNTCQIALSGPNDTHAGHGSNVLGGPLLALKHLLGEIDRMPGADPIQAGEVVTTGTLTDARPILAGETWFTEFDTPLLDGLRVTFS